MFGLQGEYNQMFSYYLPSSNVILFHPLISLFGRKINLLDEKNCKFFKQTGETSHKHENSEQFPCLYHIPHISTTLSAKLMPFSAKNHNILRLFTSPSYTITEIPDFCLIVYFCLIVRFLPQSPHYQRYLKTPKSGVHHPPWWTPPSLKTLDFKPFFNTFAC